VTSVVSATALALASLVGFSTSANAAAGLTIEVAEGSGFVFVEGSEPVFNVAGNADFIASNGTQLRVQLTNMVHQENVLTDVSINGTVLDGNYTTGSGNLIALLGTDASADVTPSATNATVANLRSSASGVKSVFGLGATTLTMNSTNSTSAMTSPFTITLDDGSDLADNETSVYLMTVFADADNDGAVDTGEVQTSATITFIAPEDVTTTVTSATPLSGASSFEVDLTTNVNEAYIPGGNTGRIGIYMKEGTTEALAGDFALGILTTTSSSVTLDSVTKAKYDITVSPSAISTTAGSGASFTIQGVFDNETTNQPTDSTTDLRGTAVTVYTGAVAVSGHESVATVVRSANAKATTSNDNANMAADVRKNTEVQVMADFENGAGANQVGKAVTWTASASPVLSSAKTVVINGTAYDSTADLGDVAIAATTNASGRVFVTVNTTGFAAGDTVTLTATADGVAEVVVLTARTAAYTAEFVDGTIAANTGYGKTMLAGGSFGASVAVADQWGVAPANGVQSVSLTRATNASRTTAANWTYTLPVVGGFASGTIVDNGAGAGSDTITATLSGTGGSGSDTMVLTYSTAAAATVTVVELTDNQGTGDSTVRLDEDSLPAWHWHLTGAADEPLADTANFKDGATTGTSDTLLAISGTAKNAAGVGVAGKEVTLSASGITFEFTDLAGNEIYARDSITVPTTSGGAFSVNAYSDGKGGSTVITATVDGVSDTTTVTFVAGTATGMDLAVPATAAQGRAVDVIVTLTDVAGDPVSGVSVSFKATGVGYLSNLSGTTDASGEVVVKLITQPGETGTATITATATLAGVATAVSKSVTVGQTASSSEQKVNAGSFKGYIAVYAKGYKGDRLSFKAGNDWNVTESLASDFVRVVEFTGAGYTLNVPIYINRVLVDTIVVTTK